MLVLVPLIFAYFIFIISDSIYLQFYLFYCDFSRIAIPSKSQFGYRLWVAFGSGHPLRVDCGSDPFFHVFGAALLSWLVHSPFATMAPCFLLECRVEYATSPEGHVYVACRARLVGRRVPILFGCSPSLHDP